MATKSKKKEARADAVHEITFKVVYYGSNTLGGRALKHGEITLKIPQSDLDGTNPLAVFSNDLANEFMPKKFKDYVKLKSYEVLSRKSPEGFETELSLMSRDELLDYVEDEDLYVYPAMYPDIEQLREAIRECEKDEESFKAKQDAQQKLYGDSVERKSRLKSLNADFDELDETTVGLPNSEPPKLVLPSPNPVDTKELVGFHDEPPLEETDIKPEKKGKGKATAPADDLDI